MAVTGEVRLHRGMMRSRVRLCRRVLETLIDKSTPPDEYTVFTEGDIAAATIVVDALNRALDATVPR